MTTTNSGAGVRRRIMSGMRPTGRLHLGHLVGALSQWVEFSRNDETFFEVADLHALTTGYEDTANLRDVVVDNVLDWLAAGVDPERSVIYVQSHVPEISELNLLLSMIVPVAWLTRVPTYKDQIEALGSEIATYGFLGYPLMQLCDIAVMRGDTVPVGRDQLPHLEFGREVVRRFNHLYGQTLVEPQATLSEFPDVPGTDNRKMSKSYGNTIDIADDDATTAKKVRSMVTDPLKVRRGDPGRPEICPVWALHRIVNAERVPWVEEGCRSGALGCVDCKSELAVKLNAFMAPVRERRASLDARAVAAILECGAQKARAVASGTLAAVKRAMHLP
ncbi:MAG: tryptophan--tRNA ligase [Candidatus Eremiobacteraeota bacterium]|nr:tryptophan--tRNA ligase [Candidatus Eremiobacteraeota bacterium]